MSQNQAMKRRRKDSGKANPIQLANVMGDSIPGLPDLLAYNLNKTIKDVVVHKF